MFYLIIGILCSALISIILRMSEKHLSNKMVMFASNYMICVLCSLFFMKGNHIVLSGSYFNITLLLGLISGVLYLVSFLFTKANMDHNGLVLTSTFTKLGVLIPTLMAIVIFKEVPSLIQIIGISISICAIIMIHFEKDAISEGNKKLWLIMLLIMCGIVDSLTNIFKQYGHIDYENMYLLLTFLTAFILAFILSFTNKNKMNIKDVIFGILIGIPNFFSSKLVLMALDSLDAIIVYPIYSVGTLITITLAGLLLFKEELSRKKLFAIIMIAISLCLLNL